MTNKEIEIIKMVFQSYLNIRTIFKKTNYISEEEITEVRDKLIKTLEQQRWIPVTEDTPPKGTICLWCNKQGSVFTSAITYRSECSSYVGKHGYFSNGLENYGDIVAWMPKPQPYKECDTDEHN